MWFVFLRVLYRHDQAKDYRSGKTFILSDGNHRPDTLESAVGDDDLKFAEGHDAVMKKRKRVSHKNLFGIKSGVVYERL